MQMTCLTIPARLVLGLLVMASAPPALAAQPDLTKTNWIVNTDIATCQLIRAGPNNPMGLKVDHNPASGNVAVTMGNLSRKIAPSNDIQQLDVVLMPSGEKFSGMRFAGGAGKKALLGVGRLDERLLAKLSESHGIAFERNGRRLIKMDFPTATAAMEQLLRCGKDLLAKWGMDASALAGLKQKAVPLSQATDVFSVSDYPASALRAGKQGVVVARVDIDKDGDVTKCVAMEPKPDSALVTATCNALTRKLKYRPGIDANNLPIASQSIIPITWLLPRR